MQGKENKTENKNNRFLLSIILSGIVHAVILFGAGVFSLSDLYPDTETNYVEMKVISSGVETNPPQSAEENTPENMQKDAETPAENNADVKSGEKDNSEKTEENSGQIGDLEFSSATGDTSSLSQIYKENSFNVSMKYPAGWTYLDQHLNSKLEGVIFWPSTPDITPPPYIHLETMDKEYFYPAKFKKKFIYRDREYYYNEPEETGGEWQQAIYVRTGERSDFIIKVIIKGEDNFNKFLPSFYAIVKSFDFKKNIL